MSGVEQAGTGSDPAAAGDVRATRKRATAHHLLVGLRWIYRRIGVYAGALSALIILFVFLAVTQPFFLTKANIYNVLAGNSDLMVISIALTFVVLSAGFDLSVGAMASAGGLVVYEVLHAGGSTGVAILAALALGAVGGGGVTGLLIGKFKLNFFVVTLGMASLIGGVVNVVTNGETQTITTTGFFFGIGNNSFLGMPIPIWISAGALIVAALVLNHTPFGRAVYAVGGNSEAARLAGINVTLLLAIVYSIAGAGAALAGIVDASRLSSASPVSSGSDLTLTAAAAVLLGGTSFFGGIGGVTGTLVGVLLISFLQNGLGLMGVSAFWQGIVTGAVLIAAVALDRLQTRSAS
jgi:ribose transport system permease protein